MECPFCADEFNDEALVCGNCGRDLRLVRPLIDENQALVAQIEELQLLVDRARGKLKRATVPFTFWLMHSAVYVIAPVIMLVAAHFLIIIVLDLSPLYLRFASMVIPLPFGFVLLWLSHHGVRWSIFDGILIGVISVVAMLAVVAFVDKVPILPETFRDWRDMSQALRSPT